MTMDDAVLKELERRLLLLEKRVANIEAREIQAEESAGGAQMVETRQAQTASALSGTVMYKGEVATGDTGVTWEIHRPAEGIISLQEQRPEELAQILGALANPIRLTILRLLLQGPQSSQSLQEALHVSSAGQLYHHLRELLSTKLIEQQGRSVYILAVKKVIPLLTLLAIVYELGEMS